MTVDVRAAADALAEAMPSVPRLAVVLGSGLAGLEGELVDPVARAFETLPGLPAVGVAGHGGRFVHGSLDGVDVLLQAGRLHAYEGHPLDTVVAPIRILKALGVEAVLLTNAVGGISRRLEPGALVLATDVLNLTFRAPLAGPVVAGEERFPDMSAPFDEQLCAVIHEEARLLRIELHEGTHAGVLGPQYETAAEVRMLARLGADVVGMSAIPEVVTAAAAGLRCAVLSLVTNKATGLGAGRLSHDEVLAAGRDAAATMIRLVRGVVARYAAVQSGEAK